ncbi:MAG: tetratricopeptide repeat protein [Thermodesulfobacteriota bacterium]
MSQPPYQTADSPRGSFISSVIHCLGLWTLILVTCLPSSALGNPDIVPEDDVALSPGHSQPLWMQDWQVARELVRRKHFDVAAQHYQGLSRNQPRVELLHWEYAQVLVQLKRWSQVSVIMESLLEQTPSRIDYLFLSGKAALVTKQYDSASQSFGLAYEREPDGPYAGEALYGLVESLLGSGKNNLAYPLMEQLYLRRGDDIELLRKLAASAMELGHDQKGLWYYNKLVEESGDDEDLLRAAVFHDKAGKMEQAVTYYKDYLKRYPHYLPFQRRLGEFFLKTKREKEALPFLLTLLAHGEQDEELFLQIGRIYLDDLRRPDKALYYFEEYRKLDPENKSVSEDIEKIQSVLAGDLVSIVENEGAWPLWRDLARVTPDRLGIYLIMADQLDRLGKKKELVEVLEIIHHHDAANVRTILRLAELHLDSGDFLKAGEYLRKLTSKQVADPRARHLIGEYHYHTGRQFSALRHYRMYLKAVTNDRLVLTRCLEICTMFGLDDSYASYYRKLAKLATGRDDLFDLDHRAARDFTTMGLYSRALDQYDHLLEQQDIPSEVSLELMLERMDLLLKAGMGYAAEQYGREVLIQETKGEEVLYRLSRICLENNDLGLAWKWFGLLMQQTGALAANQKGGRISGRQLFQLRIDLLSASDEYDEAIDLVEKHYAGAEKEAGLMLARLHLADQDNDEALDIIRELKRLKPSLIEALFVEYLAEIGERQEELYDLAVERGSGLFKVSFAKALDYINLAKQYGLHDVAEELTLQFAKKLSRSLHGRTLLAESLYEQGKLGPALEVYRELEKDYPAETHFRRKRQEIRFQLAGFSQLIDELTPGLADAVGQRDLRHSQEKKDALLFEERLLLARSLWAVKRWEEAVEVYEELLQPPAEESFSQVLEEKELVLTMVAVEEPLWRKMTFSSPEPLSGLAYVSDPFYIASHLETPLASQGAKLYRSYRLQERVETELEARTALVKGEYYQGVKEYRHLLSEEQSIESQFDLAGIYSRLGLLGEEASIYQQMEQINEDYPGLEESKERNRLKRRPRTSLDFGHHSHTGRSGYFDLNERYLGVSSWLMPALNQELELSARYLHYESDETGETLDSNRFLCDFSITTDSRVDIDFKLGLESPSGPTNHRLLYQIGVSGWLGDRVQWLTEFEQSGVDDTLQALSDGLDRQDLCGGIRLDLLPRLFGGGGYCYRMYDDGNSQNRYDLWASYILHSEPNLVELRYGYEHLLSEEGNTGRDNRLESGFIERDHPYWSPERYWQHLFSIHAEYQLAEDVLWRGVPSYFTLDYSFGYDSGGDDNHLFEGEIYLEMNPHFLLNSTIHITQGSEYREESLLFSLIYRW